MSKKVRKKRKRVTRKAKPKKKVTKPKVVEEVRKGDFVLVNYTVRVKEEGNRVIETTFEEEARKEGVYKEGMRYEPKLVIVGEGMFFKDVEDALVGMKKGEEKTIELPPEKAFGPRDPSKVKMVPLRELERLRITPIPGKEIEYKGSRAVIRTVGAGRVCLDFNPPLAGKTLIYRVKVEDIIREKEPKIRQLIKRRLPDLDVEQVKLKIGKDKVSIYPPEEAYFVEGIQYIKRGIAHDIMRYMPEIKEVSFTEKFSAPSPEKG